MDRSIFCAAQQLRTLTNLSGFHTAFTASGAYFRPHVSCGRDNIRFTSSIKACKSALHSVTLFKTARRFRGTQAMFSQILEPAGQNLLMTILASLVPLIVLLFLLAVVRMTAWLATIIASVVTLGMAVWVWQAPANAVLRAYVYGASQGVWTIDWIVLWGLVIFNTLVLTGDFERFKNWMVHQATVDIRIQTLMLAWSFGALLEGLVGFGYPWAVVVPILAGLGIADLEAIRVAALANNAPVSYGALGAPILALAAVTGLPMLPLSASVGHIVAVLALLPPWILIYLVTDWEGVKEAWPLAIVASFSYIAGQWPVARYLGPYMPDLSGAIVSFWALFVFIKVWRPRRFAYSAGSARTRASRNAADPPMSHERRLFVAGFRILCC